MEVRKDYIEDNSIEHKKKSNLFIGVTFAIMLTIIAIGFIFG